MSFAKSSWTRWSTITLALIVLTTSSLFAQEKKRATGVVEDWSTHHALFSEPGTLINALVSGRYGQWVNILNEPRYAMQQQKRHASLPTPPFVLGGWGKQRPVDSIDKDWSMSLSGSTATGAMASNAFPAKFSFSVPSAITTANCTSDYVVYTTGIAGSASQATIIGYNNLYATTCGSTSPTIAFAYNTGGSANLSPTLYWDGTQVAYIQTSASVASLVLLKPSLSSGGSVGAPATDIGSAVSLSAYRNCAAPCFTTITLNGSPNDTNSSPFYVYGGTLEDTLFVGDDAGKLHKFTGVFLGTPAETTTNWPVAASTETTPELTSPVFDGGTSQLVFVGDATGYLHSVTTVAGAETVRTSSQMDCGTGGFVDPPVIDSTTELVYVFPGYSCPAGGGNTAYINRFAAGTSIATSFGTALALSTSPSNASTLNGGTFDNEYYTTSGVTGNLYVCAFGSLLRIPISTTTTMGAYHTYNTPVSATTTCSPVTEFLGSSANTTLSTSMTTGQTTIILGSNTGITTGKYIQVDSEVMLLGTNPSGTTWNVTRHSLGSGAAIHTAPDAVQEISGDWVYMSVAANGNGTGCAGACLYNFNVLNSGTTGTVTTGQTATGGTSGIVVDNLGTATGESQIYYTTQGNATCTGTGGTGTHGCAIQASQTNP